MNQEYLDSGECFEKLDLDRVAESIALLPMQMRQVLAEGKKLSFAGGMKGVKNIVIDAMGGSNLGARIIKSVFSDQLRAPILIEAGYEVPAYVDKETLYICSSYSGTTEEVLVTLNEIRKRKCVKVIMTAKNGEKRNPLIELMENEKLNGYVFEPRHNPSGQPRLGLGYAVMGTLLLFIKSGLLRLPSREVEAAILRLESESARYQPSLPARRNPAKKIGLELYKKIPVLVSGNFLEGNMHTLRNQFNENSKNYSSYLIVPDMNHYAMEGFEHPKSEHKQLHFIFFESGLEHPRVQKRLSLTKKLVVKSGISHSSVKLKGSTRFEQSMETLQFGSWVSYYLAMLNRENPASIKWVDWFKKELDR